MSKEKSQKKSPTNQADFSDMQPHDAVAMIVNTAVTAINSGHNMKVYDTKREGKRGLLIWMPGFVIENGAVIKAPDDSGKSVVAKDVDTSGE